MIPSPGRIVRYTLTELDVVAIVAARRSDGTTKVGNNPAAGDVYPMVITRVWADTPTETTAVNGQVLLDGNDTLWVTSVSQGAGERHWFEPPRS